MRIVVTAAGGSGGRFLTEALQAAGHYVIGTDADATQLELAASNQVVTLRKIKDDASIVFVQSHYERLMPGEARSEALRQVQLELRRLEQAKKQHRQEDGRAR